MFLVLQCSGLLLFLFVCSVACCARGRGLTFTSARVLVRARNRWAKLSTHRHRSPHLLCGLCSHAHFGRATTARVSSPRRLGCPHWLAHGAEHGHFSGASTTWRTIFLWLRLLASETWIGKFAVTHPLPWLISECVSKRVLRPAGRLLDMLEEPENCHLK